MNLTQLVIDAVKEHVGCTLVGEVHVGAGNHADFAGAAAQYGAVRVEVELRRADPVNNVAKAWRQATEDRGSFTLIQVFSGYYGRGTPRARKQNAQFVGAQMCEWAAREGLPLRYVPVEVTFEPPVNATHDPLPAAAVNQTEAELRQELKTKLTVG